MRRQQRGVRSPHVGVLGVGLVLALTVLLPVGPLARLVADSSPALPPRASASLVFACADSSIPMTVDASVAPAEVADGGSVTLTWRVTLPEGSEAAIDDGVVVSFPVPGAVASVTRVEVSGTSGVDRTGWSTAAGHLQIELDPMSGPVPVAATIVASMRLAPGQAPAVVGFGAPDGMILLGGGPGGGSASCAPDVAAPALVGVVVIPATTTTTATTPTTVPTTATTAPTTTTTRPATTTTTRPSDPAAGGDAPSPGPLDPASVPVVPAASGPGTVSEVVTGDVSGARRNLDGARDDLAASTRDLASMQQRSAALEQRERDLLARRERLAATMDEQRRQVERLAAAAYVAAVDAYVSVAATSDEVMLLGTALDQAVVSQELLLDRHADLDAALRAMAERRSEDWAAIDRAKERRRLARTQVTDGRRQLATFELGGDFAVTGFQFPVAGTHDFSDTWHAPRSGGRLHQGTDVFAAEGTPLRAVERGVLTRVGTDTLGGTKLWLVGESGTQYYYAHLSAFASGVDDGVVVSAGAVIGYVGRTGNARTTSPHLHFEVHPGGGDAIDAYAMLRAADGVGSTAGGSGGTDPSTAGLPATTVPPSTATTSTTTAPPAATTSSTDLGAVGPVGATGPVGPLGSVAQSRPSVVSAWGADVRVATVLERPVGVAVAPDGNVVVADVARDRVVVLGPDGGFVRRWGGTGSAAGRFHQPQGVAVGPDGSVFVADTGNARVQRFSAEGDLLAAWDGTGTDDGPLAGPSALAVDRAGTVYVVDTLNSEVRVFTADGAPVRSWGGFGDRPGRFADPTGIAVGPDGALYVTDEFNGRVQRLTPRGALVDEWTHGLRRPTAVAVTGEGGLVVVDRAFGAVRQLGADGTVGPRWGTGVLGRPGGLAFDAHGRLLVTDPGQGRVVAFGWR